MKKLNSSEKNVVAEPLLHNKQGLMGNFVKALNLEGQAFGYSSERVLGDENINEGICWTTNKSTRKRFFIRPGFGRENNKEVWGALLMHGF